MAIHDSNDNSAEGDDHDHDSHTTLGDNSESLLAPTPPAKKQSPLQSPATQTLNTLSQTHLLVLQDSIHSEEYHDNTNRIEMDLTKRSNRASSTSPSKYCLPWKTRMDRRKQEFSFTERSSQGALAATRIESDAECGKSEVTIETLLPTQRCVDQLMSCKGHGGDNSIGTGAIGHDETRSALVHDTFHVVTTPRLPVLTVETEDPSSAPNIPELQSPKPSPITAGVSDELEAHLQLFLKSLPVRLVVFPKPGPLGLILGRHRIGQHDYCSVINPEAIDNDGCGIRHDSCSDHQPTDRTKIRELVLYPSDKFIYYDDVDLLRCETIRPLVIGLAQMPITGESKIAQSSIASGLAESVVSISNLVDSNIVNSKSCLTACAMRTKSDEQVCSESFEDHATLTTTPDEHVTISQVLFQAIEMRDLDERVNESEICAEQMEICAASLCKKGSNRLCHQYSHFKTSGAATHLEQPGVKIGCQLCQSLYTRGKAQPPSYAGMCPCQGNRSYQARSNPKDVLENSQEKEASTNKKLASTELAETRDPVPLDPRSKSASPTRSHEEKPEKPHDMRESEELKRSTDKKQPFTEFAVTMDPVRLQTVSTWISSKRSNVQKLEKPHCPRDRSKTSPEDAMKGSKEKRASPNNKVAPNELATTRYRVPMEPPSNRSHKEGPEKSRFPRKSKSIPEDDMQDSEEKEMSTNEKLVSTELLVTKDPVPLESTSKPLPSNQWHQERSIKPRCPRGRSKSIPDDAMKDSEEKEASTNQILSSTTLAVQKTRPLELESASKSLPSNQSHQERPQKPRCLRGRSKSKSIPEDTMKNSEEKEASIPQNLSSTKVAVTNDPLPQEPVSNSIPSNRSHDESPGQHHRLRGQSKSRPSDQLNDSRVESSQQSSQTIEKTLCNEKFGPCRVRERPKSNPSGIFSESEEQLESSDPVTQLRVVTQVVSKVGSPERPRHAVRLERGVRVFALKREWRDKIGTIVEAVAPYTWRVKFDDGVDRGTFKSLQLRFAVNAPLTEVENTRKDKDAGNEKEKPVNSAEKMVSTNYNAEEVRPSQSVLKQSLKRGRQGRSRSIPPGNIIGSSAEPVQEKATQSISKQSLKNCEHPCRGSRSRPNQIEKLQDSGEKQSLTKRQRVSNKRQMTVPVFPTDPLEIAPAKKRRVPSEKPSPIPEADQALQQFCNACQRKKGFHHERCRLHRRFEVSGSRELLQKLLIGVENGCEGCRRAFTSGEIASSVQHHIECPGFGRTGRRNMRANDFQVGNYFRAQSKPAHADVAMHPVAVNTKVDATGIVRKCKPSTLKDSSNGEISTPIVATGVRDIAGTMPTTLDKIPASNSMTIEKPSQCEVRYQSEMINSRAEEARKKFRDEAVEIDEVSVPFCRACNDSSTEHHALCPNHPLFAKSGAREKLDRVRLGLCIGCSYCDTIYRTGASPKDNIQHTFQCIRLEKERRKLVDDPPTTQDVTVQIQVKRLRDGHACVNGEFRTPSTVTTQNLQMRTHATVVTPDVVDLENDVLKIRLDSSVAVIKPAWKPCDSPWGKIEYLEGDVVVSGDGRFTHHEVLAPGQRFAIDPFHFDSGYRETHLSPEEGVHILKLTRDPLTNVRWGFNVAHHDFGSACLVTAVDPCSPASAAKYVGSSCCSPLCVHDMILTVNGQDVGGMTDVGFEVAMETSGVEVILGVSRYRFPSLVDRLYADLEKDAWTTLEGNLDDRRNLGWAELDMANNSCGIDLTSLGQMETTSRSEDPLHLLGNTPRIDENASSSIEIHNAIATESLSEKVGIADDVENRLERTNEMNEESDVEDSSKANSLESEDWENDDNPWVGCVCGKIHAAPTIVYWIQCESCDTWSNVAPKCVGFDEEEAKVNSWSCRACKLP